MKKSFILSMVVVGMAFTACNPKQEDTYKNDQPSVTAEQLRANSAVVVEQENGKNVNYVYVTSSVSTPLQWTNGVTTSVNPTSEFLMLVTGEQTITLTAMNPDGSKVSVDYPVNIEVLSDNHPVDPHWGILCGAGSKTWTWDDSKGNVWGNAGFLSGTDGNIGTWWGVPPADVKGQVEGYSYGLDDSGNATMTFSLAGTSIVKSSGGSGTFSFDFSDAALLDNTGVKGADADKSNLWAVGILKTTGDGVLFPVQINTGAIVTQHYINYIDEDKMTLTYASDGTGGWGEATYWNFKAVE